MGLGLHAIEQMVCQGAKTLDNTYNLLLEKELEKAPEKRPIEAGKQVLPDGGTFCTVVYSWFGCGCAARRLSRSYKSSANDIALRIC